MIPSDLWAGGSINGAAGTFIDQYRCGTLVRNGAGDYSFNLDVQIDATQSIVLLTLRAAVPALPVAASVRDRESYGALAAPGTNLVAQYAGGAPIADAVGPWTMPAPGRTCRVVLGAGGVATNYTITGEAMNGTAGVTDVIAAGAAGTFEGVRAFRRITNFASNVNPVGTTDLQIGNGFGVGGNINAFIDLVVTGVLDAATMTVATGTVVPTAARLPNGIRDYDVLYSRPDPAGTGPSLACVHTTDLTKQILIGGAVDGDVDFAIFRVAI